MIKVYFPRNFFFLKIQTNPVGYEVLITGLKPDAYEIIAIQG